MRNLIIGLIIFSIIIMIGSYFIFSQEEKPSANLVYYSATDKEKPAVEVKSFFSDMGTMKVSEKKEADFTIKNTGIKPLQLSRITTSCDCTTAKIIYEGNESDEFGMHAVGSYVGEIAPQKEAKIRLTYRPYVMPVYGVVEREAYVTTNDPVNQKLVFRIKALVK